MCDASRLLVAPISSLCVASFNIDSLRSHTESRRERKAYNLYYDLFIIESASFPDVDRAERLSGYASPLGELSGYTSPLNAQAILASPATGALCAT
jgi:hypothetical protein